MNEKGEEQFTVSDIMNRIDRRKREEAKNRNFVCVMILIGSALLCLTMLALL